MSIKLPNSEIDYILEEVNLTDRVDPFREHSYLMDYVETKVMGSLPRRINPTNEELLETSQKLLELKALQTACNSIDFETMTALRRYLEEIMHRLVAEKRAEITGEKLKRLL